MKTKIFIQLLLFIFFSLPSFSQDQVKARSAIASIIPRPQAIVETKGSFRINGNTSILYENEFLKDIAVVLQSEFKTSRNKMRMFSSKTSKKKHLLNSILLKIEKDFADETYKLEVTSNKIVCTASGQAGMFYGVQSLLQLFNSENGAYSIPCTTIEDSPRYPWRGMMLDESRHFFGKAVVKQYLDIMARLKMNRFHWHLTDEPGWRIEIKRYPLLTTIGATGNWSDSKAAPQFYTQEDIKEIVEYARLRNIMVIPEIDMPGHAIAATKAYPEVSGGGEGRWKGFTFHPGKEIVYEFLDNILSEVAALFPAPYIHIGADEVHFGNQSWFTDPDIQKFIKDKNLGNEVGLEHYFVRRMCDIIHSKGKKMIGWDEIINTGVTPDKAIVMWWRHDKPQELSNSLAKGFDVILTPRIPCYFDFVQDDSHKIGRRWSGNFNQIQTVYQFPQNIENPIDKNDKQILGLQANIWTERVKDKKRLDFMLFPRLLAIAEDAWTRQESKDYKDFENRLNVFLPYLDKLGIYYFNIFDKTKTPEPWGPEKADVVAEG